MADEKSTPSESDQSILNRMHKMIDQLIRTSEEKRVQSCEAGDFVARDKLDKVNAHLRMARSEAGSLKVNGATPTTRGGDK